MIRIFNHIFKLDVEGVGELFEVIDAAKAEGFLPNEYKIGQRIVFSKAGNISIYKELEEDLD